MSLADQFRADYRTLFADVGEPVTLRRARPTPPGPAEITVRARITGFSPDEIASGVDQGDRKAIVLAEDVATAVTAGTWPAPAAGGDVIVKGDKLVVRGRPLVVEIVDDNTRRVAGELIAYELTVTGS